MPVDDERLRRDAEHRDPAAHHEVIEHLVQRRRRAAHLQADVEALAHAEPVHDGSSPRSATLTGTTSATCGGERQAVRIDVGDDDVARADMAGDGGGHDADRPGAGDQHVLADEIEGERGVHGVAERIEDRAELVVDRVGQRHDVEGRDLHVFGEGAGHVDADALGLRIEVVAAGAAGAAPHADDVALAGHALADLEVRALRADRDDLAGIFVADDHRHGHGLLAHSSQF